VTAGRRARRLPAAVIAVVTIALALTLWLVVRAGDEPPTPIRTIEVAPLPVASDGVALPRKPGSLRFAVIGDAGRGDTAQYETARELARWLDLVEFTFVLMLGDNIYGGPEPDEYVRRFERPYAPLLQAGVTFHAALGNHDPPGQVDYPFFNMGGRRYYSFVKEFGMLRALAPNRAQFFALDTVTLDDQQIAWLRHELAASSADWQIAFYHHPPYTSARYSRDAARVRRALEALFVRHGVDVGLGGHEHVYERLVPIGGVQYFTSGAAGALRIDDLRPSPLTAAGFDDDTHFLLIEIAGDELYFQAVSRTGRSVDSGRFTRAIDPPPPPSIGR
jgi:hypothetical protein